MSETLLSIKTCVPHLHTSCLRQRQIQGIPWATVARFQPNLRVVSRRGQSGADRWVHATAWALIPSCQQLHTGMRRNREPDVHKSRKCLSNVRAEPRPVRGCTVQSKAEPLPNIFCVGRLSRAPVQNKLFCGHLVAERPVRVALAATDGALQHTSLSRKVGQQLVSIFTPTRKTTRLLQQRDFLMGSPEACRRPAGAIASMAASPPQRIKRQFSAIGFSARNRSGPAYSGFPTLKRCSLATSKTR